MSTTQPNCIDEYNAAIIRRGEIDFKVGFDRQDDNPYDHGTPEHELWLQGWHNANETSHD